MMALLDHRISESAESLVAMVIPAFSGTQWEELTATLFQTSWASDRRSLWKLWWIETNSWAAGGSDGWFYWAFCVLCSDLYVYNCSSYCSLINETMINSWKHASPSGAACEALRWTTKMVLTKSCGCQWDFSESSLGRSQGPPGYLDPGTAPVHIWWSCWEFRTVWSCWTGPGSAVFLVPVFGRRRLGDDGWSYSGSGDPLCKTSQNLKIWAGFLGWSLFVCFRGEERDSAPYTTRLLPLYLL